MKALLFCLILCPALLQAQSITFKVTEGQGKPVLVMKPVRGNYYWATRQEDTLDATGRLVIPNREKVPGAYHFFYKKQYTLYVRPGQQYEMIIDEKDKEAPVKIVCADAEGQLALERLAPGFYQSEGMQYYKQDTVFEHNRQKIQEQLNERLATFKTLLAQRKIDKGFYRYAEKLYTSHYANVLGACLIYPVRNLVFNKDSAGYDAGRIRQVDAQWRQVLEMANVHDSAYRAVYTYFDYATFYNRWYLEYFLPSMKGTYKQAATEEEDWKRGYDVIRRYYREPLQEYLCAMYIYFLVGEERFQSFIPALYDGFRARYPNSPYAPMLAAGVNMVRDYYEKAKADFTPEQRFVEAYSDIKTFDELAAKFANRTVYVDLWASWCGPCKAEFAYNDSLKLFVKQRGVDVLYISIDRNDADQRWKDMIKYYNLSGYHIRASADLVNDIRKVFGKNGSLSIPRYAILKNGRLVQPNAKHPSDGEELYRQIAAFVN